MGFFTSADFTIGQKILEVLYIIMGLMAIYTGVKNARDEENPSRLGTAVFWCAMGVVIGFGRWIPPMANGILIVIMTLPAIFKKVKIGKVDAPNTEYTKAMSDKLNMKIFIPALSIGVFAIIFALQPNYGALVGVGVGVFVAVVLLIIFNKDNKPKVFLQDSERLLSTVGPLSMLPMLLASLGAIFTAGGVGDVIAEMVGKVIPKGNVTVGIIVFAVGMAVFTMIMGNAFAAITVMTVGIGAPFVLAYGADPVVIGMLALTCGYCGTLCTPMAANFNIVPVAMLDMKDRMGVIKNQVVLAGIFLVFQICYMIIFK
ncbi:putative membrane protein [Lachnospiraceae bacterium PF1-21]|uniref:DUF979 domain-containing protein n=1 Tax=Ohessyouella blattaphilus TaxID=2949333 RepID=A0ABT1EDK5_9FIRM|nr:DUF979 domain-containing protein [Ohessyouella blattaphilus]MCP1108768.1 DUF979 domain-containing protein [Ohessyouella blattaphilus]MCR8562162.1 DUF979 domain-containing protein [Ohessyouella blattaphilus]MDL2250541.1 DUF979 domain-containing protein [Lachnospiraceae bacterium OttesenSCG-928-J05]